MDDRNIILLYNSRNERAIDETAQKYGSYCYKIAHNILSDPLDSEECVSDTYMKAWNSIPPQQPDSLRMFLAKIVRNISLDMYRLKHRQKRGGGEFELALEEIEQFSGDVECVEDELAERELARTIDRFLHSISERDCNIFLRRYYFADTVSDIATRYKESENNIRKILSRTRIKLKIFLRSEGYTV